MTKISVVISTYSVDRLNDVLDCIDSVRKQTFSPYEIILILDPDLKLEFYASRVPGYVEVAISNESGLSNARNAGVRRASGDIVAFIDDDAVADRDWLRNLVKNYENPSVFGVGGFVKPVWETERPMWFPEELDWIVGCSYKGLPEHRFVIRNPIGCNMSFFKDIFDKTGYFNVNIGRFGRKLLASEETEFSLRLLRNIPESKIVYEPSAVVYHRVPRARMSLRYLVRRSFYEGYSKALVVKSGSNSSGSLSTENRYLKYLLKIAVPSRLRRFFELKSLSQLLVLLLSTISVFLGYFFIKAIDALF